ncbi:MAG: hypothetical protein JSS27_11795 [Planctomycetes bacterium]|nr:hypothetical protein [Planctomycetota bacterium]
MQLDKTRIVIRERTFSNLLDLSLRVARHHIAGLFVAWAIGVVPFALLNGWLLYPLLHEWEVTGQTSGYLWHLSVLTVWELPLATTPITLYMAQLLFVERPQPRQMLVQFWNRLPQVIIIQVIVSGLLAVWDLVALFNDAEGASVAVLGVFIMGAWLMMHMLWPYTNEVLLLEGNSLFQKQGAGTLRRVTSMHAHGAGDVIVRYLMSLVIGSLLITAVAFSIHAIFANLMFDYELGLLFYLITLPLSVWLVLGWFAVVRYLSYLDLRIRNEGWEVELLMRAEGNRIARQLA